MLRQPHCRCLRIRRLPRTTFSQDQLCYSRFTEFCQAVCRLAVLFHVLALLTGWFRVGAQEEGDARVTLMALPVFPKHFVASSQFELLNHLRVHLRILQAHNVMQLTFNAWRKRDTLGYRAQWADVPSKDANDMGRECTGPVGGVHHGHDNRRREASSQIKSRSATRAGGWVSVAMTAVQIVVLVRRFCDVFAMNLVREVRCCEHLFTKTTITFPAGFS